MEGADSSDDSDFKPKDEIAKQADERVAQEPTKKQVARQLARVDAQTPAAISGRGDDSDDNWDSHFDQTATLQLERQMTQQPKRAEDAGKPRSGGSSPRC